VKKGGEGGWEREKQGEFCQEKSAFRKKRNQLRKGKTMGENLILSEEGGGGKKAFK